MKFINLIKYTGILFAIGFLITGCQKNENLFAFVEQPYPHPPPPPPLSNDLKNVKFTYNGAVKETSMSARRTFINTQPSPVTFYRKGFELIVRLDDDPYNYTQLRVMLPIDEKADPKPGTYRISDNNANGTNSLDISYTPASTNTTFPRLQYSRDKDKFNFNLTIRIEKFDPVTHEIAGYIDELNIVDKNSPAKNIFLKELGFTLVYDHFEVYLNDTLAYEGTTDPEGNSLWFLGYINAKLFSAGINPVFKMGDIAFNIPDFKGLGNYDQNGEYDALFNQMTGSIVLSENSGVETVDGFLLPTFYTLGLSQVKVDTWLENVLIRASITAETTQIWGNNSGGWTADTPIPNKPNYKLKGYFFQRQL